MGVSSGTFMTLAFPSIDENSTAEWEKRLSARCHANPAIQSNYFAIKHLVLDDMFRQCCILAGSAQTGRERHPLPHRGSCSFSAACQQRRIEETRGKGHHP